MRKGLRLSTVPNLLAMIQSPGAHFGLRRGPLDPLRYCSGALLGALGGALKARRRYHQTAGFDDTRTVVIQSPFVPFRPPLGAVLGAPGDPFKLILDARRRPGIVPNLPGRRDTTTTTTAAATTTTTTTATTSTTTNYYHYRCYYYCYYYYYLDY